MPLKLHRCKYTWLHSEVDACWRVQKALKEQGIPFEVVKHAHGDRARVRELTGQSAFPVIEYADGTAYREESKDMASRIREGNLGKEN